MQWKDTAERTKSLWPVYRRVNNFEYTNPLEAYRILDAIRPDLGMYTTSPNCWHNTSIVANRVGHPDAELDLVVNGLEEWPTNVDLLCDALGLYTTAGTATNPDRAEEIWQRLYEMPRTTTGPYWRFWCFGAIYLSHDKNQSADALKLLDDGLTMVKRDAVFNILTHYRRILVDGNPTQVLDGLEGVKTYHQKTILDRLEQRYRFGIEMGVENAYVLANELAQLYQERAGFNYFQASDNSGFDVAPIGNDSRANGYLTRALSFLDLAEALYTGSQNHPVIEIYVARARILMAQHHYRDALNLMKSLPWHYRQEHSIAAMMAFAAYSIGEQNPNDRAFAVANPSDDGGGSPKPGGGASDETSSPDIAEIQAEFLEALFGQGGRGLEMLVRTNKELEPVLAAVLKRLAAHE